MNGAIQYEASNAKRSLFSEFMLLITLIVVPLILVIGFATMKHINQMTTQQHLLLLDNIVDQKADTISRYINDQIDRTKMLSRMPMVQQALATISVGCRGNVRDPVCRQSSLPYTNFLANHLQEWNYYDLFLIDRAGNIIFTIKHESDFGTNLKHGPYRDSGLGKVFRTAINHIQVSNSSFKYYEPSKKAAEFVAAPVIINGKVIGAVAVQFDTTALYRTINEFSGLGNSGEVVVGGKRGNHVLFTAPLRHDAHAAFKRTVPLTASNAFPIRDASQGGSGEGKVIDWRGQEVLAAWKYLPELQWGIVVKMDADEVFGHWQALEKNLLGGIGLTLLVAYLLIYLIARYRTASLRQLTTASLAYNAGISRVDISPLIAVPTEIGVLAGAMRRMWDLIDHSKAEQQRLIDALEENNHLLDQRVAEQTEQIRAVIEHAADGIVVIDDAGSIQRVNPALLSIFGYVEEALLGQNVKILMPEPYRERHDNGLGHHHSSDRSQNVDIQGEFEGLRQSGEVFPIDLRVTDMRVGGQKLFLGIIRDITERRKLEVEQRQLALAVQQSPEAIFITDEHGVVQYANPAYETISGFTAEELIGNTPELVKSGKMPDSFYKQMWHTILSGRQWRAEFTNKRKDGTIYETNQVISPIVNDSNSVLGFVSIQHDITTEKHERVLMEHTQRLESLGVLAGGIAHDFNNLLTAILGNAALAKSRLEPTSPVVELLTNVEHASGRAADLCKQMLAYSGKGSFVLENINLSTLITEMVSLLNVSIDKNVVIRPDLDEQLPMITADAAQIQQVIMNLVINASEAIEHKSGVIAIHTSEVEVDEGYIENAYFTELIQTGRYVLLEVSDTGCGMNAVTQKKLFDPFFTTKFTGRGLGMSAILGIVRGHHGAIKVYSEEDKGTTFKLLFPCATSDGDAQEEQETTSHVETGQTQAHGTILIVDDEEVIRDTASAMLEEAGFTILTAQDGIEGVAVFRQQHSEISAVLLDMTMPRMGGEETFRELRNIDPGVKVVISSGYNEQDTTSHFADKGLAGFIQKPYFPKALQTKMIEVVLSEKV